MIEVLALLILLTVIAAIITVLTSNLLYAVISVGAVGFLLAIVFLFLSAPDVAIVQIGVEVVSLVILIRATLGREVQRLKTVHAVVGGGVCRGLRGSDRPVRYPDIQRIPGIRYFGHATIYRCAIAGLPAKRLWRKPVHPTWSPRCCWTSVPGTRWVRRPCCSARHSAQSRYCAGMPVSMLTKKRMKHHECTSPQVT